MVHDAGDLHEFGLSELAKDGLKFRALDQACELEVILGAVLHVRVSVASVIDQITAPNRLLNRKSLTLIWQLDAHCNINSR